MPGNNNPPKEIQIPVRWGDFDSVQTTYSNQLLITHSGSEFYFVFGEALPPALFDPNNPPKHIEIKPVAKLAVPFNQIEQFIETITRNFNRYKENKA